MQSALLLIYNELAIGLARGTGGVLNGCLLVAGMWRGAHLSLLQAFFWPRLPLSSGTTFSYLCALNNAILRNFVPRPVSVAQALAASPMASPAGTAPPRRPSA